MSPLDTLYVFIATAAVFFMQAGFMLLFTGSTRAHHALSVALNIFAAAAVGMLVFFFFGAGLAFGPAAHGVIGCPVLFNPTTIEAQHLPRLYFLATVFLLVPAIPLGAMAGRVRFPVFLLYALFTTGLVVPVVFKWVWGGSLAADAAGWLERLGFKDSCGAAAVHLVGGALALAGALALGPRLGKYGNDGKPRPMPGHHLALASLGSFILFLSWPFYLGGFHGTFSALSCMKLTQVALLAAACGFFGGLVPSWLISRKADAPFALNGILAALVAICACPTQFGWLTAVLTGFSAGALTVGAILFVEVVARVDDPTGVISVHGLCGFFGTLAPGLLHPQLGLLHGGGFKQLGIQALGAVALAAFAFTALYLFLRLLRLFMRLRPRPLDELRGLDLTEHGMEAYSGFQVFNER